jgi:hypothetical protein
VRAVGGVAYPTVAGGAHHDQACCRVLAQRQVDHRVQVGAAIVADPGVARHVEAVIRLVGDDGDRACGAVAAEQRALRAFQHFDALQVDEVHQRAAGLAGVDAVHVNADRGVRADAEIARLHTAYAEHRLRRLGGVHLQAGQVAGQVAEIPGPQVLDVPGRHDLHRDRHFLCRLRSRLGCDDHFLDVVGGLRALVEQRRAACDGEGDGCFCWCLHDISR